jgi:hypothetical protein
MGKSTGNGSFSRQTCPSKIKPRAKENLNRSIKCNKIEAAIETLPIPSVLFFDFCLQ